MRSGAYPPRVHETSLAVAPRRWLRSGPMPTRAGSVAESEEPTERLNVRQGVVIRIRAMPAEPTRTQRAVIRAAVEARADHLAHLVSMLATGARCVDPEGCAHTLQTIERLAAELRSDIGAALRS